jgi:NADP-dependent 3-hydroxy acid dehydrogenase YdfG
VPEVRAQLVEMAMPAEAVARAIAYAIEQPAGIDVGEVVIRPTVQA